MIHFISNILKGALMGAANVIPGVSGGTMALLTGIFERLINAIKSFDAEAIKLACTFKFKELFEHIDFKFLAAIGIGVLVSILSIARALEFMFDQYPTLIWSFFFGLILASVYFVGKSIKQKNMLTLIFFIIGTAIAVSIAFLDPAQENRNFFYLMLCGAVAMCSMILPGLSGSFILLLMGNYQLIMIDAVNNISLMASILVGRTNDAEFALVFKETMSILIPVGIGAVAGLAAFARMLSWIFKKFHDQTIALLTGFIFGSLVILWPWKEAIIQTFDKGDEIKVKVTGYTYALPELNAETAIALAIMLAGIIIIAVIELSAGKLKAD
jgi:putative membrane protein